MNYVKPSDAGLVAKDEVVDMHGVRVYVDPKASFFVVGTTMDYQVRDNADSDVLEQLLGSPKRGGLLMLFKFVSNFVYIIRISIIYIICRTLTSHPSLSSIIRTQRESVAVERASICDSDSNCLGYPGFSS
jgi:hypothetical protein